MITKNWDICKSAVIKREGKRGDEGVGMGKREKEREGKKGEKEMKKELKDGGRERQRDRERQTSREGEAMEQ